MVLMPVLFAVVVTGTLVVFLTAGVGVAGADVVEFELAEQEANAPAAEKNTGIKSFIAYCFYRSS
jgi:hypothetical protein